MKAVGIVCEYNPFHRGHLWQLQASREAAGENAALVCALSGDFVQRGEAAVYSKFARAEVACRCGADLVLELPLPWCLASAERFARGAVGMLGALGVDFLSFGSETGELAPLLKLAELVSEPTFVDSVKRRMTEAPNLSFAAAREREAETVLGSTAALLAQPNNILAVEYLKAIRELSLPMQPIAVRRQGSGHDKQAVGTEFRSASEIRQRLAAGENIENDIPAPALAVYAREREAGREQIQSRALETAMLSRLLLLDEAAFETLPDASDGLGRRLYRAIREQGDLPGIWEAARSKRYPLARLRRLCLCACLGVKAGMAEDLPPYARVLAANERGRALLRERSGESAIPILTRPGAVRELPEECAMLFTLGAQAHDFFSLAYGEQGREKPGKDWQSTPFLV